MKQTGGPENPPLITGPLAVALEANRKLFNSRFAQARRMNRRLDPDNFSRHLVAGVDPVVRSAARVNPDRVDRVVEALFDVSLQLVARECLGPASRYPLINEAWRDLLTRIPHLMVQDPLALSASVSNAVYNLSDEDTADARGWLDLMISLGPDFSTVGEFLEIGQAAAWRFGLAHYREGALEIWANLSDRLKLAVLGLPEDFPISNLDREKIRTDPWRPPHHLGRNGTKKLALAARVGGFRGFGGPFISPPEVMAAGASFFAFDSEFCWSIHADCFGATLKRYGRDLPAGGGNGDNGFAINKHGLIQKGRLKARFPALAEFTSYASIGDTLAVTVARSHRVFLLAARDFFE